MDKNQAQNTDVELWQETPGDFYSPSIHVTREGGIGINVAGHVIVMNVRDWHRLAAFGCSLLLVRDRGRAEYLRGFVLFAGGLLVGALIGHLH